MSGRRCLAVVDAYGLASELHHACAAREVDLVVVRSARARPPLFGDSDDTAGPTPVVVHDGDVDATADALRESGVGWIVAASESGVALADALGERLGLPSNGADLSGARRDKCLMAERARRHGLATAAYRCSAELPVLIEWIRARSGYPVIVKPPASAASDAVARCDCDADVEAAFRRVMGQPNVLGLANSRVMVQGFLHGTEYIVDTVSWRGRHRVAAFWRYRHQSSDRVFVGYDAMELLPAEGDVQPVLAAFARRVLDVVGVAYGPAHTEIMMVDGTPTLVEVGARLTAGRNAILGRACGAPCQLDLMVDAFRDPDRFATTWADPYPLARRAANVFLMPPAGGRLQTLPRLHEIERLPSFHQLSVRPRFGEPVPRVLGVVTLLHEDPATIRADVEAIKAMELDGFYVTVDDAV